MESITLPTRLRPYQNFESLLAGDDSIRRIFELQASIVPPAKDHRNVRPQATKQPNKVESCESGLKVKTEFDLDFTYDSGSNKSHVLNQLQVLRGVEPDEEEEESAESDLGFVRKMRLYNSEPMFHR
jgi:hypothetical protein